MNLNILNHFFYFFISIFAYLIWFLCRCFLLIKVFLWWFFSYRLEYQRCYRLFCWFLLLVNILSQDQGQMHIGIRKLAFHTSAAFLIALRLIISWLSTTTKLRSLSSFPSQTPFLHCEWYFFWIGSTAKISCPPTHIICLCRVFHESFGKLLLQCWC